jgi:uncharacterized protein (TIGR01777 family)
MRIIVTGGTGFIGSRLVPNLLQDDHEVILLSRDPSRAESKLPQGTIYEKWDGITAEGWGHRMKGADVVINLAGERLAGPSPALRWTEARKERICKSRSNAGAALMHAIAGTEAKPRIFIQASGLNYYPVGDSLVTEETPPGEGFLPYICRDCWEASTQQAENLGIRRTILRMAPVLGPDSPLLAPMILQHKLFVGGKLGSGKQWMSWIHIDDVIKGINFLISKPEVNGPFIFGSPNPVTNAEFSKTLGKVLHRPSWFPAPAFAFKVAFGEMSTTLLDGVRAHPQRLMDLDYKFSFPELEPALESSI